MPDFSQQDQNRLSGIEQELGRHFRLHEHHTRLLERLTQGLDLIMTAIADLKTAVAALIAEGTSDITALVAQINAGANNDPAIVALTAQINQAVSDLHAAFTKATGTTVPGTLALANVPSAVAQVGQPYSQSNTASGGKSPYSYSVSAGSLAGTTLDSATGIVSGTPTAAGPFSYTIAASDSSTPAQTASNVVSGTVAAAAGPTP